MSILYSIVDGPRPFKVVDGMMITERLSVESDPLELPVNVSSDYYSVPATTEDLYNYGCLAAAYSKDGTKAFCLHTDGFYNEFELEAWKLLSVGKVDLPPSEQYLRPVGCFYYGPRPYLVLVDDLRSIGYIAPDMVSQYTFRFDGTQLKQIKGFNEAFCLNRARKVAIAFCGDLEAHYELKPYTWEVTKL